MSEPLEEKVARLQHDLGKAQAENRKFGEALEMLREMVYGSKQRMDIAVSALEKAGVTKFDTRGVYLQPHEARLL